MNNKVQFLEVILSDLVSQRDILEMELNFILNESNNRIKERKKDFVGILDEISSVNNNIKTLSEYLTQLTPLGYEERELTTPNNNKT